MIMRIEFLSAVNRKNSMCCFLSTIVHSCSCHSLSLAEIATGGKSGQLIANSILQKTSIAVK